MDGGSRWTEAIGMERGGGVQILKIPPPQSSPVDIRFDFRTMCDRSFPACDLFGVFVGGGGGGGGGGFVFVVFVVFCFVLVWVFLGGD